MGLEDAVCDSVHCGTLAAVHAVHFYAVSRLDLVNEVVLKDDLHRAGKLARRSILGHFLNGDLLVVLVDAVTVLSSHRVAIDVAGREFAVRLIHLGIILSHIGEVGLIGVVLDKSLLGLFAVMHRCLDLRLDDRHPSHNALHRHHLVN